MNAGPSNHSATSTQSRPKRKSRRRRLNQLFYLGIAAAAVLSISVGSIAEARQQKQNTLSNSVDLASTQNSTSLDTLGSLIRKREVRTRSLISQYGPDQVLDFSVNVTPPRTCEPMNITFDPRKGTPPFTIFVGFSQWYPITVQLPATYADPDLATWLYQYDVPVFRPFTAPSSPTPDSVVVVSDSTGNLMNSSSFQTVVEGDISCPTVTGKLDFFFYNDPLITACNPMSINWNYTAPLPGWKDPVDIFILREMAPPIHIGVTNSSAGAYNYSVALRPGTNVMLTMTDNGGTGGVAGQNTVGGSEYISQDCLAQADSSPINIGIPSPTSTLSNLRMPDYTALVSSTITSNGLVSTAVAVATFRHGSVFSDTSLGEDSIVGLAVGVVFGAALLAGIVSWFVWRKRNGRRNLLWDVPRSAEGELSKLDTSGPIDEAYLRNRSKAMSRTGSAGVPMLPTMSPTSDNSDERDSHRRHLINTMSESSFNDSQQANSPHHIHNSPPWTSNGNLQRYSNLATTLRPYSDTSNEPISAGVGMTSLTRRGSGTSSIASNPFANSHAVTSSSRPFRQPFVDHSGGGGDSEGESLAMTDTRFHSSARMFSDNSTVSGYESDQQRYGSRSASTRTGNATYVQHSDGGLLMDDSLEEEDLGGHYELPPQYDAVPRRAARLAEARNNQAEERDVASSQFNDSYRSTNQGEEEEGDESQFWRSPPTHSQSRTE